MFACVTILSSDGISVEGCGPKHCHGIYGCVMCPVKTASTTTKLSQIRFPTQVGISLKSIGYTREFTNEI